MNEKLLVLRKLEEWIFSVQPSLRKFPKTERFTLVNRIENTTYECIDAVISANLDKARRPQFIFQARVGMGRLQFLIRVARNNNFISMSHYELYSEKISEIGKMLTGWSRATTI